MVRYIRYVEIFIMNLMTLQNLILYDLLKTLKREQIRINFAKTIIIKS